MQTLIRSSIKPQLLRRTLFRGTAFAGTAVVILLLTGTLMPLSVLQLWGFPIVLIAFIFIGLGLYPYKALSRLVVKPHQIILDETTLHFLMKGKPLFEIPRVSIESMGYVEKDFLYGLAIRLKSPLPEQVKILQEAMPPERYMRDGHIFLPYFSQSSISELLDSHS